MKGKISWKQFWVDMLGVLIGITIAFQLQNWKDKKEHKQVRKQYLSGMSSDLEKDIENLGNLVDTMTNVVWLSNRLKTDVITRNYEGDSVFFHVLSLFMVSEFLPQNASYQSLVNSGDLALINDVELTRSMTQLYKTLYDEVQYFDSGHKTMFYDLIYPFINKEVSFAGGSRFNDVEFMKTNEFVNLTFANSRVLSGQLEGYKRALEACEELKEKVDARLAR